MGNFGTRIEEYRIFKGYKRQEDFAAACGLTQANIASYVKGSVPSSKNLHKILAAHPDLNADWLLEGVGSMLKPQSLNKIQEPIAAYKTKPYTKQQSLNKASHKLAVLPMNALAGYAENVSDEYIEQTHLDYAILPDYNHCDTIVEVDGDSMYPTFCSRDKVICKRLTDWDYIEAGKAYVVNVKGQFVIKRVYEGDTAEMLFLVSDNGINYPRQSIKKEWIQGMFKVHGVISNNTGNRKIGL